MLTKWKNDVDKKLDRGEEIGDEEIERWNNYAEEKLTDAFDNAKQETIADTRIQRSDTREEMKDKHEAQTELLHWLPQLLLWVARKMMEIFARINKAAIEWCFQQVTELFQYLWSFFK